MEGGRHIKNIAKKRYVSGLTLGGRCCLSLPMKALGLRPCISWGNEASQSKTATYSYQIAQAALLSNDRKADQNRCRNRLCPDCPEEPALLIN
jgi:hypothetical protein